ncbi:MAG: chemotaxis protein CheB, partial [Spirochaetales bacterium]
MRKPRKESSPIHSNPASSASPSTPSSRSVSTPIVVGIGASAGGLEALEQFFRHMPVDSGLAFVVIQHLSP